MTTHILRDSSCFYTALVPGKVQNLRSVLDKSKPSLILNWDRPDNTQSTEDVRAYNVRFRTFGSKKEDAYFMMSVNAPKTSILLTREDGLKPLTKYDFEVRAQNDDHEGEWSTVSEYMGTCVFNVLCVICVLMKARNTHHVGIHELVCLFCA